MKITNKVAVESVGSLNEITELKLPVKIAFKLAKISREINDVLETYNEVLTKLQQEYVKKDESGDPVTLDDPNNSNIKRLVFTDRKAFNEAYSELLEIENEVSFEKLKIDDLGDIEVKSSTLYTLDWLFEA